MIHKMFLPGETLVAIGTGVRRVASMLPDVVVEMLLTRVRLRAERTLVRSFARVLSAQQSTFRLD